MGRYPAGDAPRLAPWVIFALGLPWGIVSGYVIITLVFLFAGHGITAAATGTFLAVALAPQSFKFVWAPLIDTTFNPKGWYVFGVTLLVVMQFALALCPVGTATLWRITTLSFVAILSGAFVSLPIEAIVAHQIPEQLKGSAAGWQMAAVQGGNCFGSALAITMAGEGLPDWIVGSALAALSAASALFVLKVPPGGAPHAGERAIARLRALVADTLALARTRIGLLTILTAALPIMAGLTQNFFPALVADWHGGKATTLIVTGVPAGIASVIGAVAGGWLCTRLPAREMLCTSGLALAASAVAMALSPHTPGFFVFWVLVYDLVLATALACWSAAIFAGIGRGAAATKYSLLACLFIYSFNPLESLAGHVHDAHGANAMLYLDAAVSVAAIAVLWLAVATTWWWSRRIAAV